MRGHTCFATICTSMKSTLIPASFLLTVLIVSYDASARELPYDSIDDPALAQCDHAYFTGKLKDSTSCYANLLQSNATDAVRAEAAWALGDLKSANKFFQQATKEDTTDIDTLSRWGELFADSHQHAEAMEIFKEVLAGDPAHGFALAGAANVLSLSFSGEVQSYLTPLLADERLAPGARLRGRLLAARMALEQSNTSKATEHLARATELAVRNNFNPRDVYALEAAKDFRLGKRDSEWLAKALEASPASGRAYSEAAGILVTSRFYREAVDLYQRAIDIEPNLASAQEALGINLMRINRLSEARERLERAYELDPYSPITVNTLRLLDSFKRFDVISDPEGLTSNNSELPIHLRLRKDEAAAIAPYATAMTRRAIEVFSKRYDFELDQPLVIEMYPDHDDFAVRTAGMPGLGILGVTFGYLVAMDSPSGRPSHEFQWGTTLWHELAHVFSLSATAHKVPRWYSEGLSVFEEWQSGPNPGIRIPPDVFAAFAENKLLPLDELDTGFIRPTYPNQVIVSYMQAGLICQYIFDTWGEQKLTALLKAYAKDMNTEAALEATLSLTTEAFDKQFRAHLENTYSKTYTQLDNWRGSLNAAHTALNNEDYHSVIVAAKPAINIYPGYVEADSAWLAMAKAEVALGKPDDARKTYRQWIARGGYDPQSLRDYAELSYEVGDSAAAIDALQRVHDVDPLEVSTHVQLAKWLLDTEQPLLADQELAIALTLEPLDKAQVYYLRGRAQAAMNNNEQALDALFEALEIAPSYKDAQQLLLQLTRSTQ